MKPCRKRRKQIAWLAINALDNAHAAELGRHLQECTGCRGYFDEIREVQQRVGSLPSLVPSQSAAEFGPVRDPLLVHQRASNLSHHSPHFQVSHRLGWVIGLSASGVATLLLLFADSQRVHLNHPRPVVTTAASSTRAASDFLPSFANYRAIGIQSLDRLDDLLAQQAQKVPHPPPAPTAGAVASADLTDEEH